ncbi:MAG: aminoglycoside 6'-N-acetyltransferase [Longimicrobiales bacterium]
MALAHFIRPVELADAAAWQRMRETLWPDESGDHAREIAQYLSGRRSNPAEVLVACLGSGTPIGFVELSIRAYAEGCSSDRVAFVEGWFVAPEYRRQRVGASLIAAAEEWGRTSRCTELASDTQVFNESSIAAHKALGFAEVERLVCFRKPL